MHDGYYFYLQCKENVIQFNQGKMIQSLTNEMPSFIDKYNCQINHSQCSGTNHRMKCKSQNLEQLIILLLQFNYVLLLLKKGCLKLSQTIFTKLLLSLKIIIITMYNAKFPVELIKKKVQDNTIYYKFKWNNGAMSIEPMSQLTPQLLELVHQFELKQYHEINKKVKLNETQVLSETLRNLPTNSLKDVQTSLLKTQETSSITIQKTSIKSLQESNQKTKLQDLIPQTQQQNNYKQYLQKSFNKQAHLPRLNKGCIIQSIKRNNEDILFLIEDDDTKWVTLEDLKKDSPITLCDYLLSRVRFK